VAFKELEHGNYLIKAGARGLMWQARAFLNGRQVGEIQVADTEEEAVQLLAQYLNHRDQQIALGRGADGSPSALEYAEAFGRITMSDGQEAMLLAHLNAADHCITATELAEAAGYENYNAANLQYGKLGQMLCGGTEL